MVTTKNRELIFIAELANTVLSSKMFEESVGEVKTFTYTEYSGLDVIEDVLIAHRLFPLELKFYTSFNPWSKAMAHVKKSQPNVININSRKFHLRNDKEWAACVVHELCHCAGFTHGSNKKTLKKLSSVPYKLQSIALDLMP